MYPSEVSMLTNNMHTLTTPIGKIGTYVNTTQTSSSYLTTNNASNDRIRGCTDEDFSSISWLSYVAVGAGIFLAIENILLITVIYRTRSLHTNTNMLVASLAVSDMLMGVQCCSMGMTGLNVGFRPWAATMDADLHSYDSLTLSTKLGLGLVSLLHVSALAVDRYLYILWPFRYRRHVTRSKIVATAAVIWAVGLVYIVLPLVIFRAPHYRESCIITKVSKTFGFGPLSVTYIVCLVAVLYCTFGMVKLARKKSVGRIKKRKENARGVNRLSDTREEDPVFAVAYTCPQHSHGFLTAFEAKTIYMRRRETRDGKLQPVSVSVNITVTDTFNRKLSPATLSRSDDPTCTKMTDQNNYANNLCHIKERPIASVSSFVAPNSFDEVAMPNRQVSSDLSEYHDSCFATNTANAATHAPTGISGTFSDSSDARHSVSTGSLSNAHGEGVQIFSKANLKLIKFVWVVIGTFLVCTLPSFILFGLNKVFNISVYTGSGALFEAVHFLIIANSGMNFFTITYMNREFRRSLVKMVPVCKFCFCKKKVRI